MGVRLTMSFTCAAVALKLLRNFSLVRMLDLKPIKLLCFNPSRNLSTFWFLYIPMYVLRSCWSFNVEWNSILNDQQALGTYSGMYENQKVDKFLDGWKHSQFIGLKSNILTNPKLRSDFNTTAAHVKEMVNRTPTLKNPPGRQVAAMGRGGGSGRGTDCG